MSGTAMLTRRAAGRLLGGIVIAFSMREPFAQAQVVTALPGSLKANPRLESWLRIQPDGTVTVFSGKAELGQGILTALSQIVAEELDVAPGRISISGASTIDSPDERYTYGSQSIELSGDALRRAGAEARGVLLAAASQALGEPVGALGVRDGTITGAKGSQITYWQIASRGPDALRRTLAGTTRPKDPDAYTLVGKPMPRIDLPGKLSGAAAFVQDLRLPGMAFGRVVLPPRSGLMLEAFDEAAARRLPGVLVVVRHGNFLGVVAEREEQAVRARAALHASARWGGTLPALPDSAALPDALRALRREDSVIGSAGQDRPAPEGRHLSASYSRPYISHGSVGPSCAVAVLEGEHMRVWSHTQGAFPLRSDLATVLQMPEAQVDVIHMPGSGCYGHNGADDVALDAALLARAIKGRPVKLQWMRDDEFASAPFGPAMAISLSATLGADNRIADWNYEVWSNSHAMRPGQPGGINLLSAWHMSSAYGPSQPLRIPQPFGDGDRNALPEYDLPRRRIVNHLLLDAPLRNSSVRTLGAHGNVYAIESFMDELAALAGADAAQFRLDHLRDPRARHVIEEAVRRAGWSSAANRTGDDGSGVLRGRGFAYSRYKNMQTYAAVVADIEVDRATGIVRVPRVVAVIDTGRIVNPDGVANQIEGGILQSISWTVKEQVRFDRERVLTRAWTDYPVMSFTEVPKIELTMIDRPHEPSLGAGEGALGPAAAAVGNAFANATGRRIRDLPMTPKRVKTELALT
ncbi:molybdopterin cofactor-binding domain-containing protein [Variovorax sp. ZT5P49]|uniref:xanthine dehydrogenase family protein molybdopterin-binding subunit n=1 Tax=Variovorax sp. ZT5P49 TaxID=3443733 RepID=UPI003F471FD3